MDILLLLSILFKSDLFLMIFVPVKNYVLISWWYFLFFLGSFRLNAHCLTFSIFHGILGKFSGRWGDQNSVSFSFRQEIDL
jgi:hypothetical protein